MRDWIIDTVRAMGLPGVGLLMLLENVFPPLPSEVIMPLAGYLAARREMSFWGALGAGALGSLLGACFWYAVGRRVSRERLCAWVERHGLWLTMRPEDVELASDWFRRHGRSSVLVGRLVPVVRTLISVPAGFSRMPLSWFLALSALGTTVWTGALTYAGFLLGSRFHRVGEHIGWLSWVIVAGGGLWYLYRVLRLHRKRAARARHRLRSGPVV